MNLCRGLILIFLVSSPSLAFSAVEHVVETFSGDGPFQGFDNPDWITPVPEFRNGGYYVANFADSEQLANDLLRRNLRGEGSFVSRLVIRELSMSEVVEFGPADAFNMIQFRHNFDELSGFRLGLSEERNTPDNKWAFGAEGGGEGVGFSQFVDRGTDISLDIRFDAEASELYFSYDSDVNDNSSPVVTLGPIRLVGRPDENIDNRVSILVGANDTASIRALVDEWSIRPFSTIAGDFNGNEILDTADIDMLTNAVREGTNDVSFDLNDDKLVNELDRDFWVSDRKNTYYGDANLDGEFNSSDLINVFGANEYEDAIAGNSSWATGDWNGDADFTSSDLVVAFQDGGYELGPRLATQTVPEPSSNSVLLFVAFAMLYFGVERKSKQKIL